MDRTLFDILNHVNEGIIITDDQLNIIFWNTQMEFLTNIKQEETIGFNLYVKLPNINKNYFRESINSVIEKDYKYFFPRLFMKV